MTICRKNYPAEQNAINQREGFPAAAAFNLWHGAEFYFSCVTFYDNRFILGEYLCDSSYFGVMLRHTCAHKHADPLVFLHTFNRNLCVNYSAVLDVKRICSRGVIPDSELLSREREILEEAGSTPSEFIQSWSTCRCYMSENTF